MATYKVSTQSQLKSALNSAKGGDSIVLKSGNYGTVYISGEKYSSTVKITSESSSNPATFSKISVTNSSNLTFDHLNFEGKMVSGYGSGVGMRVNGSSNITVQNSDFDALNKGMEAWGDTNLKVVGNNFDRIGYDGLAIGHTQGVLIQGNNIDMHAHGDSHRDGIQFYNQGTKAPSANITIKNNVIKTDDGVTHGIYMGNNDGKYGNTNEFYKNVVIENNTIKTGQLLGLAVGGTQGLSIRNNVVVQSEDYYSKKTVNQPMILVDKDAKGVSLSGNTVLKAPAIADDAHNWSIVGTLGNTGSKIVSLGASVSSATSTTTKSAAAALTSSSDGDEFRFLGSSVGQGKTNKLSIDFSDGDLLILSKYANHTFNDVNGGNVVQNNSAGNYVKIDSLTDLQELVHASKGIKAKVSGDTLTIDIAQAHGTHHLVLAGLGHEYQNSYDATLF
jgi:preprotein translocase subunit YajC